MNAEVEVRRLLGQLEGQFPERQGFVTNRDILKALKISRPQPSGVAKRLVELGHLRQEGRGPGTRYVPSGEK